MSGYGRMGMIAALALVAGACEGSPLEEPLAQLAYVLPAGGATGVDPNGPIVIAFTHGMMSGMEQYMALHTGTVDGPVVAGGWMWTDGQTRATFQPAFPLSPQTRYVIHIGGGMMDAEGQMAGLGMHGEQMGGTWLTRSMMSGGMMSGGGSMMGPGWQHVNGSYGMVFEFTTG